jgi:hypothetical protein
MAGDNKRRFSPIAGGVTVLAVIALALVIWLIIIWLKPGPQGPQLPPTSSSAGTSPQTAKPTAQPADCPDVQVIAVPGTWESKSNDDPYHPTANPNSLMLKISAPLQRAFPASRVNVWTTPYVAQFSNPVAIPPDGQASYTASRTEGNDKTVAQIKKVYQRCQLTGFLLMGFSQGAVIAGDIASTIGNGQGPIPADNVLGVGLISDPRREPGDARTVGPNPSGVGVEAALGGFTFGGLDLRGKRDGGFGTLKDRTYSLCGEHDPICNEPADMFDVNQASATLGQLQKVLSGNSHALYATTQDWSVGGQTAVAWMEQWANKLIAGAPKPAHK